MLDIQFKVVCAECDELLNAKYDELHRVIPVSPCDGYDHTKSVYDNGYSEGYDHGYEDAKEEFTE